ncbi:MAG TPA: HIT family protein [Candidatus Methylomirabilis sp.]|nr:HIT family protein [Candidatus Methylomirabilis sp.]
MTPAPTGRAAPDCVFCRIIRGGGEGHTVLEDGATLAFLDHRPLFRGHCLVVPRDHVPTLADLPDALIGPLFASVRLLARAVEAGLGAEGSFVAVNNRVSQSVPHLHVHVVPRRRQDGLRGFFWPRQRYESDEEMTRIRDLLRAAVAELRSGSLDRGEGAC